MTQTPNEKQSTDAWTTRLHLIETALDRQVSRDDVRLSLLLANTKDHYLAASDLATFNQLICPDGQSFVLSKCTLAGYQRPITTMALPYVPGADPLCKPGELGLAPDGLRVVITSVAASTDNILLGTFGRGLYPEPVHDDQPDPIIMPSVDQPDRAVFLSANPNANETSDTELCDVVVPPDDAAWYVFDCWAVASCPTSLPPNEWTQLEHSVKAAIAGINALVRDLEAPPALVDYLGSFRSWPWPFILLYMTATEKHLMLHVHLADVAKIAQARDEWTSLGACYVVSFGSDLRSTIRYGLEVLRDLDACLGNGGRNATAAQPWVEDAPDYMLLSEAIPRLADGGITLKKLSKTVKPDGPMRFMRKGRRCKVHIGDFTAWWKHQPKDEAELGRILDNLTDRKKAERRRRGRPGE